MVYQFLSQFRDLKALMAEGNLSHGSFRWGQAALAPIESRVQGLQNNPWHPGVDFGNDLDGGVFDFPLTS